MGSAEKYNESYRRMESKEEDLEFGTVGDCMRYLAEVQRDTHAFIFGAIIEVDRETVTWLELYEKARALINLGVKRDEIVGINIRPCPEWLYVTFGCMLAGIKAVGLAFMYTDGKDLIQIMKKLETCSLLVLDPGASGENWDIVRRLLDSHSKTGRASSAKMSSVRFLLGHKFPVSEIEEELPKDWPTKCFVIRGQPVTKAQEGEIVSINTRGELWVKGPVFLKEYFHDPEKTARAVTPDGWFKTDDLAMMDEEGRFYVYG